MYPGQRLIVIIEHLNVGIDEDARQPGLPGEPLVGGDHGDLAEVVIVFAAEEFDFLPRDIHGVVDHSAQVEQHVYRAGGFQFVQRLLFKQLEIGKGEFADDGNVDEVVGLFDGNHVAPSFGGC